MDIAIINKENYTWTTCCISAASDIIDVERSTIYRWMDESDKTYRVYRKWIISWKGQHIPKKNRGSSR